MCFFFKFNSFCNFVKFLIPYDKTEMSDPYFKNNFDFFKFLINCFAGIVLISLSLFFLKTYSILKGTKKEIPSSFFLHTY